MGLLRKSAVIASLIVTLGVCIAFGVTGCGSKNHDDGKVPAERTSLTYYFEPISELKGDKATRVDADIIKYLCFYSLDGTEFKSEPIPLAETVHVYDVPVDVTAMMVTYCSSTLVRKAVGINAVKLVAGEDTTVATPSYVEVGSEASALSVTLDPGASVAQPGRRLAYTAAAHWADGTNVATWDVTDDCTFAPANAEVAVNGEKNGCEANEVLTVAVGETLINATYTVYAGSSTKIVGESPLYVRNGTLKRLELERVDGFKVPEDGVPVVKMSSGVTNTTPFLSNGYCVNAGGAKLVAVFSYMGAEVKDDTIPGTFSVESSASVAPFVLTVQGAEEGSYVGNMAILTVADTAARNDKATLKVECLDESMTMDFVVCEGAWVVEINPAPTSPLAKDIEKLVHVFAQPIVNDVAIAASADVTASATLATTDNNYVTVTAPTELEERWVIKGVEVTPTDESVDVTGTVYGETPMVVGTYEVI